MEIGNKESHPCAFEDATVDKSAVQEHLKHNAAFSYEEHPDAVINSCSQCCMEKVNGQPNILGILHRLKYTEVDASGHKHLNCGACPLTRDSRYMIARDGNGNVVYGKDGKPLTQAELTLCEIDSTR